MDHVQALDRLIALRDEMVCQVKGGELLDILEADLTQTEYNGLPHNIEAEQALFGAIFTDNRCIDQVSPFLTANDFYDPLHKRLYAASEYLIEDGLGADHILLKSYFSPQEPVGEITVYQYLDRLAEAVTTTMYAAEYGKTIHGLAIRRRLFLFGTAGPAQHNNHQNMEGI